MKYAVIILLILAVLGIFRLLSGGQSAITNVPSEGESIVAFGDSLVEGVGASKGQDFVSLLSRRINEPIINLGRSGDTTSDALARIDLVLENDPKVVLLLLGGNDYLKKVSEAETFANLEQIIERIHRSGSTVVLLGVRGGVLRDGYKSRFSDLAKKHQTAYVSDVLEGLLGNPSLMSDSIHPNDRGYAIIADRVLPELEKVLR